MQLLKINLLEAIIVINQSLSGIGQGSHSCLHIPVHFRINILFHVEYLVRHLQIPFFQPGEIKVILYFDYSQEDVLCSGDEFLSVLSQTGLDAEFLCCQQHMLSRLSD